MNKIVIAIVSFNNKHYMKECIESIRRKVTPGTYLISVVDNASSDGIAEWLAMQPDILLTQNSTNRGFGPASNMAVSATCGSPAEAFDVLLLNNDTIVTSTAIPRMMDALYSSDDIGAVGPIGSYAGNRQQINITLSSTEEYLQYGESLNIPPSDRWIEKVRLNGFAMLVRRKVWDNIGGFDEDFAPGYYEDDALSIEILKRGYRLILSRDSFIYHAGSASFAKSNWSTLSADHHQLFIQKYGFDILEYVYPSGAVISQIPYDRKAKFNVLQAGSGLGAELKAIRSLYKNAEVVGIEKNPVLYDISSKTENVFPDITSVRDSFSDDYFDLLIIDDNWLADISESEKSMLVELCSQIAIEIDRLHDYDLFPFSDIILIIWDEADYNHKVADYLANWGIMSSIYTNDNLRKRIDSYGIPHKNILFISSDSNFRTGIFFLIPNLHIADTTIIPYLSSHFGRLPVSDPVHKKAELLSSLEKRLINERQYDDRNSFLDSYNITITINRNCLSKLDSIESFLSECYRLGFTNSEYRRDQLIRYIMDDWNDCAYVCAKDEYADYGIIAFFCNDQRESTLPIFAFSWVVKGLGIDQYIYSHLGYDSASDASRKPGISSVDSYMPWISEDVNNSILIPDTDTNGLARILIKGSRNLLPLADFLVGGRVTSEFGSFYPTKLFTGVFHTIIYSFIQDDYDSWESNSDAMLSDLFLRLDSLCEDTLENPEIILLLGSEISFPNAALPDQNLAALHKEINPIILEYSDDHKEIRTINISDYILDQSDYRGSVNIYSTRVYSDIVEQIVIYINQNIDSM